MIDDTRRTVIEAPAPLEWGAAQVEIVGGGSAFPLCRLPDGSTRERLETDWLVDQLAAEIPEDRRRAVVEHLDETLGVKARSWSRWIGAPPSDDEEDAATLAVSAARRAIGEAGLFLDEIAGLVLATSTPPRWTGATSALVAAQLGLRCAFFDVRSGCAGGLYSIVLGATLAHAARRPVLVIGADTFSKTLPPAERLLAVAFGDGAGALVLAPTSRDGGLQLALTMGEPSLHGLGTVKGQLPPRTLDSCDWQLSGDSARFAVEAEKALSRIMGLVCAAATTRPAFHVVHAAQASVIRRVVEGSGAPGPCWLSTLEEHGNLGAASLPVALCEARRAKALPTASTITLGSVGGGLSAGAALWRMP